MGAGVYPRLPTDILKLILDYIEPYAEEPMSIDSRRFLSVESFDVPPDSPPGSVADISRFRATCKEFSRLGAPLLFRRVATRFSHRGLQRLEEFTSWSHLTVHVRKFSYLVPYFFEDGVDHVDDIRGELRRAGFAPEAVCALEQKAQEQRSILARQDDSRTLQRAIASFTSLQFIQLLRVTDAREQQFLHFLRAHDGARQSANLNWSCACSHASSTIGKALLQSNEVPWSRFSSPMLSPASVQFLRVTDSLTTLAARLTCLTLHFDDGDNLDAKMQNLSGQFGDLFRKATKLEAVHLGFPCPLTLPLEQIFQGVTWEKLVAFGIQGWELDAGEIIDFVRRHKNRLRGLRLRDVHLKGDSRWKTVLGFLRDEVWQLKWVSLRRIGYSAYLHSQMGAEIGDFGGELDSSESDEEEDHDAPPAAGPSNTMYDPPDGDSDAESEAESNYDSADSDDDSDHEHGPGSNEMDFPLLNSPITPTSAPWCDCNGQGHFDSLEDLGDDGQRVDNAKRKSWERWVLRRCPEHGER